MAVSDAGIAYLWAGVHDYVVAVDASTGVRGADIPSLVLRSVQGQLAVLAALNDSLLIASATEGSAGTRGLPNRRSNMKRTPRHDYLLPPPSPMLGRC